MYRLLAADDNQDEREGIEFLIGRLNLPLLTEYACNGKQAWEMFVGGSYDILLTDIKMPYMDGLELAEKAKEAKPALKVIVLSGHGEFEYAKKAIMINVAQYLLKPIDPQEFESSLLKVIELCRQDEQRNRMLLHLAETEAAQGAPVFVSGNGQDVPETDLQTRAVDEVIRIIGKEYDRELSLEYLAGKVHLSTSYMSNIFKKQTGESVVKFINRIRMEKAKEFLCQENYKIVDIYRMVGFSDASYFGVAFKNHYGLTPSQFRAKVRSR